MTHTAMTHTYVTMEISAIAYAEIRARLRGAGYDQAVDDDTGELDMHGIALVVEPKPDDQP